MNLPIVQAPFVLYYAYNPLRLHETIVAPNQIVNMNNLFQTCKSLGLLDPLHPDQCSPLILQPLQNVLQNPGRLNYFEPSHTFRFTVTRSF